jgi:DNA-directed RNA polymerase specialized sigma24 family protein
MKPASSIQQNPSSIALSIRGFKRGNFPPTTWSKVRMAGSDSETQAGQALEFLCGQYWYPIYVFVRRDPRTSRDAEDHVQGFFAHMLSSKSVALARPERGRFRTFLLVSLKNFLANEWHRARALKRGGGRDFLSLDFHYAEDQFRREPIDPGLTPEQAFDRSWAVGVITTALASLGKDYAKRGRGALFASVSPRVWGGADLKTHREAAASLGMTPHAFTVELNRLRGRLAERLRADVAETVGTRGDLELEIRHLIAALKGPASFQ